MNSLDVNTIIGKLRESFKNEEVKKNVLDPFWYAENKRNGIDSTGFCFYASEILYRLAGGKSRFKFVRISREDWPFFGPHYFLYDKLNDKIVDVTSDQYKCDVIPYAKGKGRGLQRISNMAKLLSKYIGYELK